MRLLESIAAGYGAAVACGRPLLDGITAHRLHPPGIVGCFGAAAAAARALGSSADETAGALSLAGCLLPFAPFESFTKGAPVKDMYAGWPAYMGVMTALMAGDGVTGPVDAFEAAEDGVAQLVCHGLPSALADVDPNEVAGTQFKAFATCRSVQPALTALAALLPLDPGTIDGVAVETYPFAVELSADSDPGTAIGAKTSIPYCVAAYLLDGEVGPASFHPAVLGDPRRGLLASLVTVRVAADMIQPLRRGARIEVRLTDGTVRRHAVRAARWSAEDPATERDIREKFRRLAGRRAEAIERAVADLPDASDVERLRSALAP